LVVRGQEARVAIEGIISPLALCRGCEIMPERVSLAVRGACELLPCLGFERGAAIHCTAGQIDHSLSVGEA